MITNFGKYDVGIFFTANYLCSGSFYDCFEYFHMFKKNGFNVCLILLVNESVEEVWRAIKDRYRVSIDITNDLYVLNRHNYTRGGNKKIVALKTKVLFSPSMSAISQMFLHGILVPYKKVIASQELPYDHPFIKETFEKNYKYNILMLRDDRVFPEYPGFENRIYRQTINFDIFKTLSYPVDDRCLINLCTDHKCYPVGAIEKFMEEYFPERWLLYTKDQWYDMYKPLESKNVKVEIAPIKNFMNQFDKMLYLPSLRGLDPSPRLLPECCYFGKKVIYHHFDRFEPNSDGGYWRWRDCLENFDSLKMTKDDEIFDIVNEYL